MTANQIFNGGGGGVGTGSPLPPLTKIISSLESAFSKKMSKLVSKFRVFIILIALI